jgi:hypothetical protein
MAEPMDTQRMLHWLRPAPTEVERAQRSEDWFWVRLAVWLAIFATIGALGILKVRHATLGVRTSYELVQTAEELRVLKERKRSLEGVLAGQENPNNLRTLATPWGMRAATTADEELVD